MSGGSEGSERREATIVFCDLGGYTRWNEEEDPEDVALVEIEDVGLHRDVGEQLLQGGGIAPVRRRLFTVQQARMRQHEAAGTDRAPARAAAGAARTTQPQPGGEGSRDK